MAEIYWSTFETLIFFIFSQEQTIRSTYEYHNLKPRQDEVYHDLVGSDHIFGSGFCNGTCPYRYNDN
ncbi:hypothetical protein NPIRD3C_0952 [Nitrosopumilus piranensis]|uniref:Uncharacterized protein n=1 Tax=Nitrosopumilus piranensis TaxID=1582439 RepID=A0A0C5BVB4_9ARCH|nr:hypothetical protein NPIRD3C_0952 [Nitrosopumilus piranensis]